MAVTGINSSLVKSGGMASSSGLEFKLGFIAAASTEDLEGLHIIGASTDFEDKFAGNADLIDELKTASLNSNSNFWAVVNLVPTGELTKDKIADHLNLIEKSYQVSLISVLTDADLDFANEVKNLIVAKSNLKRYYEFLLRFRQAKLTGETPETPEAYATDFKNTFKEFSCDQVGIIVPTDQKNWLGAVAGRVSKTGVQRSVGRVASGALINVSVNPEFDHPEFVIMDEGRGIFLKKFPESPTEVQVNDDNVMYSATSDIKTLAQARVANKALREVNLASFPLINDETYSRDQTGATAAAQVAGIGLKRMTESSVNKAPELFDYTIESSWTANGIANKITLIDVNRVKIVENKIVLTEQEIS